MNIGDLSLIKTNIVQLETILDSINGCFFVLDKSFRFIYANNTFRTLCSKTKVLFIGKSYWELFPEEINTEFWKKYQDALTQQEVLQFEGFSTAIHKLVSVTVFPKGSEMSVYFTDISVGYQEEQTTIKANKKLAEVAYMQSHMIRKPIGKILELIKQLDHTNPGSKHNCDILSAISLRCKELVSITNDTNRLIQENSNSG